MENEYSACDGMSKQGVRRMVTNANVTDQHQIRHWLSCFHDRRKTPCSVTLDASLAGSLLKVVTIL